MSASRSPLLAGAIALVLGLCLSLASGAPLFWFPLAFIAQLPLLWLYARSSRPFGWGFLAGAIFYLAHLFWLVQLQTDAPVPRWLLWVALVLLVAFQAAWWGLFALFVRWVGKRKSWFLALAIPSAWTLLEYARVHMSELSFTWATAWMSALGDQPLVASAAIWGPFGISWVILAVNVLVWRAAETRKLAPLYWAAGLVTVAHLVGFIPSRTHQVGVLRVALVQPNLLAEQRDWPEMERIYRAQADSLRGHDLDLVILSESAFIGFYRYSARAQKLARLISRDSRAPVLFATADARPGGPGDSVAYFNTAFLVDTGGLILDTYDKVKLVPFGERFPFAEHMPGFVKDLLEVVGNYSSTRPLRPLILGKVGLGVLICFESTFPDVARRHVQEGAQLLVNITNDGWYGPTLGPVEHFHMARFRAVEQGRYLVRVGKTGISAVIDRQGRIVTQIGLFKEGIAFADVPLMEGRTPYAVAGDWPVILSALITALALGYTVLSRLNRAKEDNR